MKRNWFCILAALALCLVLLPGTALAAECQVTITDLRNNAVTLEAGKKYVPVRENGSGVKAAADTDTPEEYLTYADGVLTVYGTDGVTINGSMAVTSDLTIRCGEDGTGELILLDSQATGAALSLAGHTLTLDPGTSLSLVNVMTDYAVDSGTIRYSEERGNIRIESLVAVVAVAQENLTVENAAEVYIVGNTQSGPLLPSLTVKNCGDVTLDQWNSENSTIMDTDKITSDGPIRIGHFSDRQKPVFIPTAPGKPGGTIWAYGGEAPTDDSHFLDNISVPTFWAVGTGGEMYYEPPAAAGGTAKMTLKNAECSAINHKGDLLLELVGENKIPDFRLLENKVTLTGNGSLEAKIYAKEFEKNDSVSLTATVTVDLSTDIDHPVQHSFIYGKQILGDYYLGRFWVASTNTLTVASGAELTITETGSKVWITEPEGLTIEDGGTIVNNGEIILADGAVAAENIPAYIRSLGLTGTGKVTVKETDTNGIPAATPSATYSNTGKRLLEPAGELDLTAGTAENAAQGYSWNADTKTLTLQEGFNATKVILPDDTVTVVTQGESTIQELAVNGGNPQKTALTLSGAGPLKIEEQVNVSGGNNNSLTVAAGAVVEVRGGVSVCGDGGVDGAVTINGTLTVQGGAMGPALTCGRAVVGGGGVLNVYGEHGGVSANGMSGGVFAGAFTLLENGVLNANCKEFVIAVHSGNAAGFNPPVRPDAVISIPAGYIPQGHDPMLSGDGQSVLIVADGPFTISRHNVPTPPKPSHTHKWAEDWTSSETHHWHECTASGCKVTEDSQKNGYGEHVYDDDRDTNCNVCGYTRTVEPERPSEPSGSGGGGSSRRTRPIYSVTVEKSEHGTVTTDHTQAERGVTVTLTAAPDSGYALEDLTVTDSQGGAVKLTGKGGGKYAFTMPERSVTVRASFRVLDCDGGTGCPSQAFSDLDTGKWYHDATDFVLERGLMNGYGDGTFRPGGVLTRAQVAQILYNQAGRPAAAGGGFSDVAPGAWCAPAVAWAAERGIVSGYAGGTFRPDGGITREQLAVMLWRYAGSPAAGELDFTDAGQAGDYAREALGWAVENGVLSGRGDGILDPKGPATRAQAAQTLKNFLKDK